MQNKKGQTGIGESFQLAFRGFGIALSSERNFQIHLVCTAVVVALILILGTSIVETMILVVVISLILSMELINTSMERLIDIIEPSMNSKIKEVKDMLASAVLVSSMGALIIGIFVFVPKIFEILRAF
ncbi:MAG: hypothetical protein ACD_63C00210G0001 [uncultured bacterium]|nr:MAG: hypothetical protein ACD_63C00210G0001 [uncultured bacterium]